MNSLTTSVTEDQIEAGRPHFLAITLLFAFVLLWMSQAEAIKPGDEACEKIEKIKQLLGETNGEFPEELQPIYKICFPVAGASQPKVSKPKVSKHRDTEILRVERDLSREIAETIEEIRHIEQELLENRNKVAEKIKELKAVNPLYSPEQDPFESDSDFVARSKKIAPMLEKLRQQYLGNLQQRLEMALDREFEDREVTITLGRYNANNQYWPISLNSQYISKGLSFSGNYPMKKKQARHLHQNWERYRKTAWLRVDSDKKVRISRFQVEDPVTGARHEFGYDRVWRVEGGEHTVVSEDGRWMFSGNNLLDLQSGRTVELGNRYTDDHPAVFSPVGGHMAVVTNAYGCQLTLYSLHDKKEVTSFRPKVNTCDKTAFSPDGRMVASYESYAGGYSVFDLVEGRLTDASKTEAAAIVRGYQPRSETARYRWSGGWVRRKVRTLEPLAPPPPVAPPSLHAALRFLEPSGNGKLDAGEAGALEVTVTNRGKGDGESLFFHLEPRATPHLSYAPATIGTVPAGKSRTVSVPLEAYLDIESGEHELKVHFVEANGFPPEPASLKFQTVEWMRPQLTLVDFEVTGDDKQIDPAELFTLKVEIQNKGKGVARGVYAHFHTGRNTFIADRAQSKRSLGELQPGETSELSIQLFTNKQAEQIELYLDLTELTGQAGNRGLRLPLSLHNKSRPTAGVEPVSK